MEVRDGVKVSKEPSPMRGSEDGAKASGAMQNFSGVRDRREPLWVFGYGSLCWNPGFEYQQSVTGFVTGFSRRFWQGNTTHRGTDNKCSASGMFAEKRFDDFYAKLCGDTEKRKAVFMSLWLEVMKPGRVATLVEDKEGVTWGRAFLVAAEDNAALPYLAGRECRLGGYRACTVPFHPRRDPHGTEPRKAVLYVAVPENKLWLGAAPLPDIAKQILECRGPSGPNAEYLLRLANFMREEVPEALDDHLFSLERLVRKFAAEMRLCLGSLMGESDRERREESPKPERPSSHQYASRIPEKKLRCVNM